MKTNADVDALERLIVQLKGLHDEISQLAKKSPNDGLNKFKLKLVNSVIASANTILPPGYRPFSDFSVFLEEDVPSNSDVTLVLTQYIEQVERFRSDNVTYHDYEWVYVLGGKPSRTRAKQSTLIGAKEK
ncbi:hypothetical protein [Rhizobium wenxiniae]|uniref:hypothetical protein n=1 Tax=Rhizobium wenxiniae TaxID=1737357 RepID=UPI003C18C257